MLFHFDMSHKLRGVRLLAPFEKLPKPVFEPARCARTASVTAPISDARRAIPRHSTARAPSRPRAKDPRADVARCRRSERPASKRRVRERSMEPPFMRRRQGKLCKEYTPYSSTIGLLVLALAAVPVHAEENDYPTAARADYVIGCMAANGNTREALLKCSCAIDTIAGRLAAGSAAVSACFAIRRKSRRSSKSCGGPKPRPISNADRANIGGAWRPTSPPKVATCRARLIKDRFAVSRDAESPAACLSPQHRSPSRQIARRYSERSNRGGQ